MGGIITQEDWWMSVEHEDDRQEDRIQRNYRYMIMLHPDCRDPYHPGCVQCEPELFGEQEDDE